MTETQWSSILTHKVNKLPGRNCSFVADSKGTLDMIVSSDNFLLYTHRHNCTSHNLSSCMYTHGVL